jgi:hypothetical protein
MFPMFPNFRKSSATVIPGVHKQSFYFLSKLFGKYGNIGNIFVNHWNMTTYPLTKMETHMETVSESGNIWPNLLDLPIPPSRPRNGITCRTESAEIGACINSNEVQL